MSCKCAKRTDEYHGWECEITEGACMFLIPDSKACAEQYGEGPDVVKKEENDAPISILTYQLEFYSLTKTLYDEKPKTYAIAIIAIRLEELQEKAAYAARYNKPNRNGTKITFKTVKNAEEYEKELKRIINDGEMLGLKFEKEVKKPQE